MLNASQLSFAQLRLSPQRFANWLAGEREPADGLRTLDCAVRRELRGNAAKEFRATLTLDGFSRQGLQKRRTSSVKSALMRYLNCSGASDPKLKTFAV
jgi:hypothetical protein